MTRTVCVRCRGTQSKRYTPPEEVCTMEYRAAARYRERVSEGDCLRRIAQRYIEIVDGRLAEKGNAVEARSF